MIVWLVFSILLALVYAAIMLTYQLGWRGLPVWNIPGGWQAQTRVTVLIPARNESAGIGACLHSILDGSYPADLTEILVLDDFSDDGTVECVRQFERAHATATIRVLRLSDLLPASAAGQANKKRAIEWGVAEATGKIIVATDADCIAGKNWLSMLISRLEHPGPASCPVLVTGPVLFHREQNLLQRFQSLDFLGLMGITGAGIHLGFQRMGNGASMAYYRNVFQSAGGYEGNRDTASGDDMFLIQKLAAQFPDRIAFVKNQDAAVRTEAKPDVRSFLHQRLRWGTKNAGLPEWPVRLILLAVFLFCWSIWINGVAAIFSGRFIFIEILVIQLVIKICADWMLLGEMARFFRRDELMRWFFPAFLLHTLYIPVVGTASLLFRKYDWKGRKNVA